MAYKGSLQTTTGGAGKATGNASIKGGSSSGGASGGSGSSGSGNKPRIDNQSIGKDFKPAGGGGGSSGGSSSGSSGANFSTIDGREIQVTASGKEVAPNANFSDMNRGPVYVPPPSGGARSLSSGGRNVTPADANFMTVDGRAVNVPAPSSGGSSQPLATMGPAVDRIAGFERRVESQAARQAQFERFVTEDKGQYKVLGVTMDRPDVQNIRSLSNVLTGGTNLNPFSQNFGIQTDRSQRSSFGRVTEDILFGGLSYPFLVGGAAPMAAEKTALTIEASFRPETRRNVLPELGRSAREVEKNAFSFLPGGTPINEAGATTLASAVIFGALGAQPARAGTVKTIGAKGPIDVEILSVQKGTASGANIRAPVAPRSTTILKFTETVKGAQRFTRGRTAETTLTMNPEGGLSRVTTVGRFRFEIEQAPKASRAIAREYRDGNLVRARDVPAIKQPKGTARITELFRSEDARIVVQPRPDVLAQAKTGGRVLQVEQPAGRGRTIIGLLEEVTTGKAVSRAGKTKTTPSMTSLELTFPRGTDVVADLTGRARESPTRLRVGDNAKLARQEAVRSSNRLVIDDAPVIDLTSGSPKATRGANVKRVNTELGTVETAFEYASITRGQLFVERGRGRIRSGMEKIQERLDRALDFEQRRPKTENRRATEDLLGIERPKAARKPQQRAEPKAADGPLELIGKPARTAGKTRGEFYVEGLDITFAQPRGVEAALRGSTRTRPVVAPPSTRIVPRGATALLPGLDIMPPQTRQDTMPEQLVKPLPRQSVTPVVDLITETTFRPRQRQDETPFAGFDTGFEFDFDSRDTELQVAFALPFGGGGGGGFGAGSSGRQRFKNAYSPSITGGLFNVKGTKKQANIATITGLGVRPFRIG